MVEPYVAVNVVSEDTDISYNVNTPEEFVIPEKNEIKDTEVNKNHKNNTKKYNQ